jgi:2,4-dienoyl-CoA reductase-like NADH-dependent reductase (Old Yellow Enzyme family)
MSKLSEPLTIKDVTLRNRIALSPMCQYTAEDGFANNWHLVHYGSRAVGGAGLIIQEATAVSAEGRISPGDLGIYGDQHIEKLKEINAFIHQHGAIAGIQLAHAGRKAGCARPREGAKQLGKKDGGWTTLAPSSIAFQQEDAIPQSLDEDGIRKVAADFKAAAFRAHQAGYKVIEIHAAHGYLIHQFLSPLSNKRSDNYGGSFENRIRFLLEIVDAVKSAWPERLPLFIRISATDWAEGGWNLDEAIRLCSILKLRGIDLVDCSSGGLIPNVTIPVGPGFQVPFAERIRKEAGLLTGAVGLITGAVQAEDILVKELADLVIIGREFLRDPYFTLHAAQDLGDDIPWPLQYGRAKS